MLEAEHQRRKEEEQRRREAEEKRRREYEEEIKELNKNRTKSKVGYVYWFEKIK